MEEEVITILTPTKRALPERKDPPFAVVVHTTGERDLQKILKFYIDEDGFQPHYMIGKKGLIYQFVAVDHIAYHTKIGIHEADLYTKGLDVWTHFKKDGGEDRFVDTGDVFSGYKTWMASWPSLGSPLELVTGRYPNNRTIGIELQQPEDNELTPDIFLGAQYDALTELLQSINLKYNIPLDRHHVLGHYDCAPMNRCNAKGGWDPGDKFNWDLALAQCLPTPS